MLRRAIVALIDIGRAFGSSWELLKPLFPFDNLAMSIVDDVWLGGCNTIGGCNTATYGTEGVGIAIVEDNNAAVGRMLLERTDCCCGQFGCVVMDDADSLHS